MYHNSIVIMSDTVASPYKVSTITATASLLCNGIDSSQLFESVDINSDESCNGFSFIEYGVKNGNIYYKGFHKKLVINRRKKKTVKRFDNQTTVIIRLAFIDDIKLENALSTNMKIFKNGNVQMTGLKTIDQGHHALKYIIEHIKSSHKEIVENKNILEAVDYKVRLINSDFKIGFQVKRESLFRIMQKEYMSTFCTYEPCIYPGVKIEYDCNNPDQKVSKKITIAVFQSGCIIITGAQSYQHVDAAYEFICNVLQKHKIEIKKQPLPVINS